MSNTTERSRRRVLHHAHPETSGGWSLPGQKIRHMTEAVTPPIRQKLGSNDSSAEHDDFSDCAVGGKYSHRPTLSRSIRPHPYSPPHYSLITRLFKRLVISKPATSNRYGRGQAGRRSAKHLRTPAQPSYTLIDVFLPPGSLVLSRTTRTCQDCSGRASWLVSRGHQPPRLSYGRARR